MEKTSTPASRCDFCAYYDYDEESEQYVCEINLDEDEMVNFLSYNTQSCPYFSAYDEYKMVNKQN